MKINFGIDPSTALQSAKHKLFVEGASDGEIDPIAMESLLRRNGLPQIEVAPMGGCDNVRSAAQALVDHHPNYYFIIDRDDQSLENVERSWAEFPNLESHNMIIWRKRELENYFCDPAFLARSDYLNCTEKQMKAAILKESRSRVYMEAANLVLLSLHSEVRKPIAKHFANISHFKSKEDSESQLEALASLALWKKHIGQKLLKSSIKKTFRFFLDELSGGKFPIEWGTGSWNDRMSGKEIFRSIAGKCFTVRDVHNHIVQGHLQNMEIAKNLLQKSLSVQPTDFQQLVQLLKERVKVEN